MVKFHLRQTLSGTTEIMTDEQIIAAAGEPHCWVVECGDKVNVLFYGKRPAGCDSLPNTRVVDLRTADAILSAAKYFAKEEVSYLAEEIRHLKDEVTQLRAVKMARFNNEDCWIYQGDGEDHLESLSCPVVIYPNELKNILSAVKPLRDRIAELEANASTMKAYYEQVFEDGGKRIAELTKQRDELIAKAGEVMRERCACLLNQESRSLKELSAIWDESPHLKPDAYWIEERANEAQAGDEYANAIRALPGVTLADITAHKTGGAA